MQSLKAKHNCFAFFCVYFYQKTKKSSILKIKKGEKKMTSEKILAIDVGTTESGCAIMQFEKDDIDLIIFGKMANENLMQIVKHQDYDQLVYEQFQSFGMAVGESTIESILWNGRFIQAAIDRHIPVERVYRKEEKLCLCNSLKAKDSNIRQALIDRYAKTDKKNGRGTKKAPDVFYGVSKDVWSAIAVGVTWKEKKEEEMREKENEKKS